MAPDESAPALAPAPAPHLKPLTSLRFFSALTVFAFHVGYFAGDDLDPSGTIARLMQQGRIGVSFFFVLSGFVLTWVYRDLMRDISVRTVVTFYISRIARILPLHWLTMALAVIFTVVFYNEYGQGVGQNGTNVVSTGLAQRVTEIISSATLTQAFVPYGQEEYAFNGVAWSLSAEMFFYALFPFLLFAFVRLFRWQGVHVVLLAVALMAINVIRIAAVNGSVARIEQLYGFAPFRLSEFVLGIGVGLVMCERVARGGQPRGGTATWTVYELCAVGGFFGSLAGAITLIPYPYRQSGWYPLFMAFAIFVFAHQRGAISRVLGVRPFVLLGEISYGFYMWHALAIVFLYQTFGTGTLGTAAGAFTVTLMLSIVTYRFVEVPARRRIRASGARWLDARIDD